MSRIVIDQQEQINQQEQHAEQHQEQHIEQHQEQQRAVEQGSDLKMLDDGSLELVDYYGSKYKKDDVSLHYTGGAIDYYLYKKYGREGLRERIRPAKNKFTEVHHKRSRSIVMEGGGDEIVEFMMAGSNFQSFRKDYSGFKGQGKSEAAQDYRQYQDVVHAINASGVFGEEGFNPQKWGKWARFKSFVGCIFKGFKFRKHDEKNRIRKIYEVARKQKEIDDLNQEYGSEVTINNVTHKHVRYKSKELSNGAMLHRYNIAGATTIGDGTFNRGSHSIEKNEEYIKYLGEERLRNWITEYNNGNVKPIRFLFRGHSRGGDACVVGAMMIKQSALDMTKDNPELREALLKNLKFEIIQHDPVAGLGSNSGVNEEVDYHLQTKAMKERNLPALGDNVVESTVFYSMHSNHTFGFTPQSVLGAKRVILTPTKHNVNLNRIQVGTYKNAQGKVDTLKHSQVYTDAKTRIKYRGAGISELPEGLYIQKENGELVKMENIREAMELYRKILIDNDADSSQEGRHDVIENVIAEYFSCSYKERRGIGALLERKNDDTFVGFSEDEKNALKDGAYDEQRAIVDGVMTELLKIDFKPKQFDNAEKVYKEYLNKKDFWLKAANVYNLYINKDKRMNHYFEALPEEALNKFKAVQGYIDNMLKVAINFSADLDRNLKAQAPIDLDKIRPNADTIMSSKAILTKLVQREQSGEYNELLEHYGDSKSWTDEDQEMLKQLLKEKANTEYLFGESFAGEEIANQLCEEYKDTLEPSEKKYAEVGYLIITAERFNRFKGFIIRKISLATDPKEKEDLLKAYNYCKIRAGLCAKHFTIDDIVEKKGLVSRGEALARGGAMSIDMLLAAKDYFKSSKEKQEFLINLAGQTDEYEEYDITEENRELKIFHGIEHSKEEEDTIEKNQKGVLTRKKEAVKELMYISKLSYNELEQLVGLEKISIENMILRTAKLKKIDGLGQVWTNYFSNENFIDKDSEEDMRFYHQMIYIHNLASIAVFTSGNELLGTLGADDVFTEKQLMKKFGPAVEAFFVDAENSRKYLSSHKMIEPKKYVKPSAEIK